MAEISIKNILAEVEVPSVIPLEEMASKLGAMIGGIIFDPEVTGRFEEVPAFVAKDVNSGMTFILFCLGSLREKHVMPTYWSARLRQT